MVYKRNTRRNYTQEVVYKNSHSKLDLESHPLNNNGYVEDPRTLRAANSGMTALYDTPSSGLLPPSLSREKSPSHVGERMGVAQVKGFTLIELLVVVLIIGILAAVALPQYQKTIISSRFIQLQVAMDSVVKAQKNYYLANGKYTKNLSELDIQLPETPFLICRIENESTGWVTCTLFEAASRYKPLVALQQFVNKDGKQCCSYPETNYKAEAYCMKLVNKTTKKTTSEPHCYATMW